MKLSCFTTVFSQYPLEEAIRKIAGAGYDGVDLMAIRPHSWPQDFSDTERKNLLSLLRRLNMKAASVTNFGAVVGLNPSSPKERVRRESIQYQKDCIELASDLESRIAMIIPGWFLFGESYEKAWKWAVEGLRECMPLAEDKDIIVAIEPAFNLLNSVDSTIRMMKEVTSKNVGVCLDTFHTYTDLKEPLADSIRKLGKALVHLHVWDAGPQGPVPFGKGFINFDELIKVLNEVGYDGYLAVECMPFGIGVPDPDEYVRESSNYLNALFKKYQQ